MHATTLIFVAAGAAARRGGLVFTDAHGGKCGVHDAAAKWNAIARQRNKHRLDVFVSGIEGAGHHGAVNGFVVPIATAVAGVRHPPPMNRESCVESNEMPYFVALNHLRRPCRMYAMVGWESYPSDRRLFVKDRLAALYAGPRCFPDVFGGWPPSWHGANPLVPDGCWRCGSWQATLEDLYARLLASDRLDARVLASAISGLKTLVLWRDFARASFSHAHLDGKGRGHALMLAAHAAAMAHDAAQLNASSWRVLHYETLDDFASYVAAGVALVDFLGLPVVPPYDTVDGVRGACAAARNATWRAPSKRKALLARHATQYFDDVAEVDRYFSHRWAIFDDPRFQLIPHGRSTQRADASPPNGTRAADCPPPSRNPCEKCPATPITNRSAARWCSHNPALADCCELKRGR